TGYGYIQQGEAFPNKGEITAHRVTRFTEKPDLETAQEFLADGGYSWNAGIFFFRTSTVLAELERQQPEIFQRLEAFRPHLGTAKEMAALAEAYAEMPSISFDYAVMENAESVYTVKATFDWDDLGSWASVARHLPPDADGNVIKGEAITIDSHGNTVESKRLVALVGVDDLVVVDSGDAVLVCPKDRAQDVRAVVDALKAQGRVEYL
ncbi:MAG: mannose-1-phosphate guanylyltransferase, partial [Planctomycetes bacterium]|nr:mannose-1-phosphate guanylyltransferase [Planctomycetota bacterium]